MKLLKLGQKDPLLHLWHLWPFIVSIVFVRCLTPIYVVLYAWICLEEDQRGQAPKMLDKGKGKLIIS